MKITIYELLGLIKDDKAPAKIKYENSIYELSLEDDDYYSEDEMRWFTNELNCLRILNDEVEIIEDPKKIEKIEIYEGEEGHYFFNKQHRKVYVNCAEIDFMVDKFNELIDEVNKLNEE